MPYQALLWVALHNALDDLVSGEVLLVATDDLDAAVFVIGSEEGEVLQDVQHYFRPQHAYDCSFDVLELALLLVLLVAPWTPHIDWHTDGAVAEKLALAGEREHIRNEHRRHLFLVNLVHLESTVEPRNCTARGRFGLANNKGQTVDEKDYVKPFLHCTGLVRPLIADRQ